MGEPQGEATMGQFFGFENFMNRLNPLNILAELTKIRQWKTAEFIKKEGAILVAVLKDKLEARTVRRHSPPPTKPKNEDRRGREFLFPNEVKALRKAVRKASRTLGHRDDTLIFMMYRHALRVGEVVNLRWDQISLSQRKIYVRRQKKGPPSFHFLEADEIAALELLKKTQLPESVYVFSNQNGEQLSTRTVHWIVARAGNLAGVPFSIHPHMLRHAKGYQLANRGTDTRAIQLYFGHKWITSTTRYTDVDPERFRGFGRGD